MTADSRKSAPGGKGPPQGAELASVGLQFTIVLLAFLFVGRWLDGRLGTEPWLLLAGVFVGFGLSTLWMYRRLSGRGRGR
ncbi:MAG TPA: AtpZ/AtpI family protein [Longimicrobium sp.]|nr:AtpZ/AtpI family protein [Longimicrobium sp.]